MLLLASDGEMESSVHRFQVAAALPDIVRQLISQIITGTFPEGGISPMKNIGITGNVPDISNLQNQLRRTFIIPITGVGQASLKDALNDPEPITLEYPFVSVHHSDIDSLLSMFVPDQETVKELGDVYGEEAIVYTIIEDEFTQDGIIYVPSSVECVDGVDAADCVRDINGDPVSGGCCPDAEGEGDLPTECVAGVDGSDCIRDEDGVPIFGNCCEIHPTECVSGVDSFDCVRDEDTGEIISGGCCEIHPTLCVGDVDSADCVRDVDGNPVSGGCCEESAFNGFCDSPITQVYGGTGTGFIDCGLVTGSGLCGEAYPSLQEMVTAEVITQQEADDQEAIWDALVDAPFRSDAGGYGIYCNEDGYFCPCYFAGT